MVVKYLKVDTSLIKNHDILRNHYKPETIRFREPQLKKLGGCLSPVTENGTPRNYILQGEPGTGKTTTARIILREIKENTNNAIPVYLNCLEENTPCAVFRKIFTLVSEKQIGTGGIALSTLCHRLGELLTSKEKILVLCLDDINLFSSKENLNITLNRLLTLSDDFPTVRICIIAIINDTSYNLSKELDASTLSDFGYSRIPFPDYTPEEINAILSERSEKAFLPGVISPDLIRKISTFITAPRNLRLGIDLLYKCAMHAEISGKTTITDDDLLTVLEETEEEYLNDTLRTISARQRNFFVRTTQSCEEDNTTPNTSVTLYDAIRKGKRKPMSKSTFNTYMNRLSDLKLIEINTKSLPTRGRVREIQPLYRAETIQRVCTRLTGENVQ